MLKIARASFPQPLPSLRLLSASVTFFLGWPCSLRRILCQVSMSSSCLQWSCWYPSSLSLLPWGHSLFIVVTPSLGFSRDMLPSPMIGNSLLILLYAGCRRSEVFIPVLFVHPYPSGNEEEAGFGVDVGSLCTSPPLKVDSTM